MANPTTNLNITLPVPAAESSRGTWGTTLNDAIQSLDTGIADRGVPSGGTDDQILTKNGTTDYATEWATRLSSVAVTGSDGIEVDSGSPLTANGTIALGVNKSTMLTFLNAEDGATADQTNAEIKTAYEANSDTNEFSDAEQTKLSGIETSATTDQTAAEVRTLVGSATDSNVYTDSEKTKLTAIEASATTDQTGAQIKTLYQAETNAFTDAQFTKLAGIETAATADQTVVANVTVADTSITTVAISAQEHVSSTVVFSKSSHGLAINQPIIFTDSGVSGRSLPTLVIEGLVYYVQAGEATLYHGIDGLTNNFRVSTTPSGSVVAQTVGDWQAVVTHTYVSPCFPLFVTEATGDLPPKSRESKFAYDPNSGSLYSTSFVGTLTGSASGIADGIVSEAKMQVSNAPTNGYVLTARSGNTGGMTWEVSGTGFDPAGTGVAMAIALG